MKNNLQFFAIALLILVSQSISSQQTVSSIDKMVDKVEPEVIQWRRVYHEFPELSNREFETSKRIEAQLRKMGLEVHTGIAHTGVVAVLDSGRPGPTIGLRADIDGLPVVERADLPFASKAKSTYRDKEVGVMHACGHDTHIAMLLGAAKVLTSMKDQLTGKVVFVFQPAEEGAPFGEEGGAQLMVKEGLIERFGIEVMFGQHINSQTPVGHINYRLGGLLAASDRFEIKVKGKQSHGSQPWAGVDPVTVSAQIILGLQNIVSRQVDLTKQAAVITVGKISGGVRNNIIPEQVEMEGTIRTLDVDMQKDIHERIKRTATLIAESAGATAEVTIYEGTPITFNDLALTRKMLPSLYKTAGEDNIHIIPAITGAEDFAFYAQKIPSMFFFTGGMSPDMDRKNAAPHHTPDFILDEAGMKTGVKALLNLTLDYMKMNK